MLHWINQILDQSDLNTIQAELQQGNFIDGKKTAGYRAKRLKQNQQLKKTPEQAELLNRLIIDKLERNALFQAIAVPKRIHRPLFSRYSEGMQYGKHIDNALMDKPNALRTDLAVTVFLNEPDQYDGGELIIDTPLGEQSIKLPAGDAVVYPATTLHRVASVTSGERLAAVTWVQSYIRDPGQREILFDMNKIRRQLDKQSPDNEETDLAHKVYANLMRLWIET